MTYFPNKMLLGKNVNKIKSEHIEAEGRLYLECCYYVYVSVSYDGFQKKKEPFRMERQSQQWYNSTHLFSSSSFSCWLSVTNGVIWSFVGPALVIILVSKLNMYMY